jgi:hypothetical protein
VDGVDDIRLHEVYITQSCFGICEDFNETLFQVSKFVDKVDAAIEAEHRKNNELFAGKERKKVKAKDLVHDDLQILSVDDWMLVPAANSVVEGEFKKCAPVTRTLLAYKFCIVIKFVKAVETARNFFDEYNLSAIRTHTERYHCGL